MDDPEKHSWLCSKKIRGMAIFNKVDDIVENYTFACYGLSWGVLVKLSSVTLFWCALEDMPSSL